MLPTSKGVPYLSDGFDLSALEAPRKPRSLIIQVLIFFSVFVALQSAYNAARETWVERLLIDNLTVKSAALLINTLSPQAQAVPVGTRLKAPGGGINILNGCEGTEVLFLLVAAFIACPLTWRVRLVGLLCGTLLVFVLNQARILALFYAFRSDKALFDLLHTIVAPVVMIAIASLFFHACLTRDRRALAPAA